MRLASFKPSPRGGRATFLPDAADLAHHERCDDEHEVANA